MAIQYRAVTAPVETAATTVTVSKPAGVADGDLLIFYANNTNQGGASQILPPTGWTLIPGSEVGGVGGIALWYKIANSEPASYTTQAVNISSILSCGILAVYSDTGAAIKVDAVAKQVNSASSTTHTWPSVTASAAGLLACFATMGGGSASSPDSSMTERWDAGTTKRAYLQTQSVSAGATGTRICTGTTQASTCVSIVIVEGTQGAWPGPQFRETVVVSSASKTGSQTITAPTTLALGDMMLLQVAFGPSDATPTSPAGWTASEAIAGASSIRIYWKIAVLADIGATYTVTWTGTKVIALAIVACYSPGGLVLTLDATSSQGNGSASSATLTAVTPSQANAFVAWFISDNSSGTTFSGADAIVERYDNAGGGQPRIACATELTFASGSTGTRTATFSSAQISNTATISVTEVPAALAGPLRANDGLRVYYNDTDISGYIRAFSLEVTVKEIAPINFVNDNVKQASLPVWLATLAGIWDKSLDDIFGAEVVGRGTSSTMYNFKVVLGKSGYARVQCLWTATAFVNTYQTKVNIDDLFLFDAKVALSGVPARSTV